MGKTLEATSISERRACALVGLSRDSWRHPPRRAQAHHDMSERIKQLAHEHRRFGYRQFINPAEMFQSSGTENGGRSMDILRHAGEVRITEDTGPVHDVVRTRLHRARTALGVT